MISLIVNKWSCNKLIQNENLMITHRTHYHNHCTKLLCTQCLFQNCEGAKVPPKILNFPSKY